MTDSSRYAAVVLAAGFSSRMGWPKALLRLGSRSVMERMASNLRAAGILDILVVTGHRGQEVGAEAERLALGRVHNPDFAAGMLTSVQAGSRALDAEVKGFFVIPVDCPLVEARTYSSLIQVRQSEDSDVVHPTCCGRRGHPPLLAARLRGALSAADPHTNLRLFLEEHALRRHDLDVADPGVLMDMDTPRDFRLLETIVRSIDRLHSRSAGRESPLSDEDALHLLSMLGVEERVIRHGRAVAAVAAALAEEMNSNGARLDVATTRAAGILHDLAKGSRRHATVGRMLLTRLGLSEVGKVVGGHMVLTAEAREAPTVDEGQLVYLADKLVLEDRICGPTERAERALERCGRSAASLKAVERRMSAAADVAAKVERVAGRSVAAILHARFAGDAPL